MIDSARDITNRAKFQISMILIRLWNDCPEFWWENLVTLVGLGAVQAVGALARTDKHVRAGQVDVARAGDVDAVRVELARVLHAVEQRRDLFFWDLQQRRELDV